MEVHVHEEDGVLLIEPAGDIDGKSAPDFQDQVVRQLHAGGRMIINMERVPFMSSAGLRAMLLLYREAKAKNEKLVLTGVNKDIRGSMSATGFLPFFTVCDSVAEAMKAES